MKSIILTILFALTTSSLFAQCVDETISVSANLGDLVSLHLPEVGGSSRWVLEADETLKNYQVDSESGTMYLVARKDVSILLVITSVEADQRLLIYRYKILVGGSPDPSPEPEPEPKPIDEYVGPNDYGLGIIAYNASRAISGEAKQKAIVQIDTGIKRLQGVGGILFISSPQSRDSIFNYLRNNLDPWTNPIVDELESRKNQPLRLKDWLNMLNEVKEGINA